MKIVCLFFSLSTHTRTICSNHLHIFCLLSILFYILCNIKYGTKIEAEGSKMSSIEIEKESLLRTFYQCDDNEGVCLFSFLSLTFFIHVFFFFLLRPLTLFTLVCLFVCLSFYVFLSISRCTLYTNITL